MDDVKNNVKSGIDNAASAAKKGVDRAAGMNVRDTGQATLTRRARRSASGPAKRGKRLAASPNGRKNGPNAGLAMPTTWPARTRLTLAAK